MKPYVKAEHEGWPVHEGKWVNVYNDDEQMEPVRRYLPSGYRHERALNRKQRRIVRRKNTPRRFRIRGRRRPGAGWNPKPVFVDAAHEDLEIPDDEPSLVEQRNELGA